MCSPIISKMYAGGAPPPDFSGPPAGGASAGAGAGPKIEEVRAPAACMRAAGAHTTRAGGLNWGTWGLLGGGARAGEDTDIARGRFALLFRIPVVQSKAPSSCVPWKPVSLCLT